MRQAGLCAKTIAVRTLWNGVVAQLVERLVRNEKVAGSIPVGSTIPLEFNSIGLCSTRHGVTVSSVVRFDFLKLKA